MRLSHSMSPGATALHVFADTFRELAEAATGGAVDGIAFFLPPVGVGLSIASGIARVDVDEVSRSYFPYLLVLIAGLALIAAWPALTSPFPG